MMNSFFISIAICLQNYGYFIILASLFPSFHHLCPFLSATFFSVRFYLYILLPIN